ncbi:WG repeat-containing protein [Pseudanabaenaceae cyanobacterium LEGE 13415]|nr:WG repeat-containing protein [Pseudanabaenaceae cyanobacterium LEGE 13415]
MKKYIIAGVAGVVILLLYRQVAQAQHDKDLSECIAKFEKIRVEAAKVERVELSPFWQGQQGWGYRDRQNKVIILPQFREARGFFHDRAVVADRNSYKGFVNAKGEIVIPYRFVWVTDFFDGVAFFSGTREDREQRGFIDRDGTVLLTFRGASMYDFTGFKNGRAEVYVHEADMPWGFLVPLGNPVPKIYGSVDCTGKVEFNWLNRGQ